MMACSAHERLSFEGGGRGDELFCSVKHEEYIFFTLEFSNF
jgi:hypothetical protein